MAKGPVYLSSQRFGKPLLDDEERKVEDGSAFYHKIDIAAITITHMFFGKPCGLILTFPVTSQV